MCQLVFEAFTFQTLVKSTENKDLTILIFLFLVHLLNKDNLDMLLCYMKLIICFF